LILVRYAILVVTLGLVSEAWSGEFEGDLVLFPEGCQSSSSRICNLKAELTYKSSRNGLVWKTNVWSSDAVQSGTTDGASIPLWAQPIIGKPYDETYLKAAIIHDHYCYPENQVRSWRKTHRMFYDAMIDLGVKDWRAKIMYFAVYLAGPKWVKLVKGENCGEFCIQNIPNVSQNSTFSEPSLLRSEAYQKRILELYNDFRSGKNFSINDIENRARNIEQQNFFFNNENTYQPTGPNDPNLHPRL